MWLNPETRWTWERLWPLEERFWRAAPAALAIEAGRIVLAQAARELLLAQSSDWQFIISTGAAADYAEQRLRLHTDDTDRLLTALEDGRADRVREATVLADELGRRDDVFPDILTSVRTVLGGPAARQPR
jgi:1,4-alpha-glucan branching enzyme